MSSYPYTQYPYYQGTFPHDPYTQNAYQDAYRQNTYQPDAYSNNQASWTEGWVAFNDPGYIKGLLLGAGLTYLMTNPKVQRAVVKGAVTLWTSVQGGLEEVKEQIQDIKSEMSMQADGSSK